jgi:hypothetical protein
MRVLENEMFGVLEAIYFLNTLLVCWLLVVHRMLSGAAAELLEGTEHGGDRTLCARNTLVYTLDQPVRFLLPRGGSLKYPSTFRW